MRTKIKNKEKVTHLACRSDCNADLTFTWCIFFFSGKGANVILDCIGGGNWEQNVSCLAMDGRWVLYGTMGGRAVEGDLLGKLLSKRGHLLTSLLRSRSLQVRIWTRLTSCVSLSLTCWFMSHEIELAPLFSVHFMSAFPKWGDFKVSFDTCLVFTLL